MKLYTTKETRQALDFIHFASMEDKDTVDNIMKALLSLIVLKYEKGETITVPFIGEFTIEYEGDKYVENGKTAQLNISVKPDSNLNRLIGKIQDGDETEITDLFKRRIADKLGEYLKE